MKFNFYLFGIGGLLVIPACTGVQSNITYGNPGYDGSFWREGPTGRDFFHVECTPEFFRRAGKYIEEIALKEKPYFLYLALPSPHTPILPANEYKEKSGINPYADFILMIDEEIGKLRYIIS